MGAGNARAGRTVLVFLKLGTANAAAHLEPLARCGSVSRLHVVREAEVPVQRDEKVTWHTYGRGGLLVSLLRMLRAGARVLRSEPVDYVVAFNPVPWGLVGWLLARLYQLPVSMSLIGDDFNVHCRAWYAPLLHIVLRSCDSVTGTGQGVIRQLAAWGVTEERLRVLPHAVDLERFASDIPPAERQIDLLFVGDLVTLKRVDDVLRAFQHLRRELPAATLVLVGDGPERERLETLAEELGVTHGVTFTGRREDVETFYRNARIFVLASEREGLPLVLAEAMCCGCVPVATPVGSLGEVLEDGRNGFFVNAGDPRNLAARLGALLARPDRLARASQSALESKPRFAWDTASAVWTDIL